jgi:sigma-B regulation protein RsbU (phosphoserine phosphatase)
LSGATVRLWRLEDSNWVLVGGPETTTGSPRAPREPGQDAASFVAVPDTNGLYLETVPLDRRPDEDLTARLLAVIAGILHAEETTSSLTGELAARYEEIDLLYTIGELLGKSPAVEEVASYLLREVCEVIGAGRGGLRVYDPESKTLRTVALIGTTEAEVPREVSIDAPDEVTVARAFRSMRFETGAQPDWVPGEVLAVPIIYSARPELPRVVGTIALADRLGGGSFTREETKLLAAVATQIGAALENARLAALARDQQRLERELELAHDLQLRLMPTADALKGEAEVAVHCVPAESLGGDFYTFSRLGGGRIGVMLGDVSSHGFSAALIAAQVMAAAGIHANANTAPDATMELLRDSLTDELESTEMYFSVFYGILDPTSGWISYSNAGHPYAYRVSPLGPVERLGVTAPPLGLESDTAFGRATVPWNFGRDLLVLCTDGLIDREGADGQRYGEERLLARLEAARELEPAALVQNVLEDVDRACPIARDDVTLLILRM